jgi:membrane-associated protease RseP (regulator of RpoE activity)
MGKVKNSVLFFKDPNTNYTTKFDGDLIIFIYNLIWWIVFINFSVALGNMMPLGLFDGGRVFYLTMLWITKSEKVARKAYKLSTYLLIGVFLLLTFLWFINFF